MQEGSPSQRWRGGRGPPIPTPRGVGRASPSPHLHVGKVRGQKKAGTIAAPALIPTPTWGRRVRCASSSYLLGYPSPSDRSSPSVPNPRASYQHPPSNPTANRARRIPSATATAYRAYPSPHCRDMRKNTALPIPHASGGRCADTA